jgi:hypothetical protein
LARRVFEEVVMNYSRKHPNAEAVSSPSGDTPWPISVGKLASLIDLGWSDYQIADYFGVEQSKLSGLRAYYGFLDHPQARLSL